MNYFEDDIRSHPNQVANSHNVTDLEEISIVNQSVNRICRTFYVLRQYSLGYNSARHVLRAWLNALSTKSRADLLLVKEFIEKADKELKHRFPGPSELKWYGELIFGKLANEERRGHGDRPSEKLPSQAGGDKVDRAIQ
jgi:hypothetical protein